MVSCMILLLEMDKINYILLTAFIILTVSSTSGYALRCYFCEQSPFLCRSNLTCSEEEDACLQIRMVNLRTYKCWKMSQCSKDVVAREFSVDSFRHLCCQRDFCNKSPSLLVSTIPIGISAVIVVWMMSR
ncbi:LOW QUALITY PROTEIN: CD59 glycoprotein-like [Thamnophis elegans]|uniref:LOW QUALITY PROTEIN: CD59 glycoprotein-like n=1 Tax=Thamnophis elegans TaxID=35005 RepID=UPI001378157C|nr:LOW QUALITY PROTEIN: CD59 glycoprotein-like [Thamnophis elegans]